MSKQKVAILLLAVVAVSALAFGARADAIVPDDRVAVMVQPAPEGFSDGGDIPEGMIAVFVEPARDGFSDGGDIPEGFVAVIAQSIDGFSDGGDIVSGAARPRRFLGRRRHPPGDDRRVRRARRRSSHGRSQHPRGHGRRSDGAPSRRATLLPPRLGASRASSPQP